MSSTMRAFTVMAAALSLFALLGGDTRSRASQFQLFEPTHIVSAETEYYTTSPQQGRPADGKFKPGTQVQLIKDAGSYSQVKTDNNQTAYVATNSLTRVLSKEAITPDVKTIAKSINGFSWDLFRQLGKEERGNLFVSPASISSALAMTYAGAVGQTHEEMAHVLHFDRNPTQLPPERFHKAYGQLTNLLNSGGSQGGYVLRLANRLWGQESYEFRPEFLALTRDHYGAELTTLDFAKPEAAAQEINDWVEQQTGDKIKDLVPATALSKETRLVLTNAIYFLGSWAHEFPKSQTAEQPFFITAERHVDVPLMSQTDRFGYTETDDLQLLELPYRGYEISMIVLLPKKKDGLSRLESQLTGETVSKWTAALRPQQVHVFLPKFKVTTQLSLSKTLSEMGMPAAFTDGAELSRISASERLKISECIHKAFVEVNEKGTEAAAATAVVFLPASAAVEPEVIPTFRADHPFVYLLRDNRSGAILFLGRLQDPK